MEESGQKQIDEKRKNGSALPTPHKRQHIRCDEEWERRQKDNNNNEKKNMYLARSCCRQCRLLLMMWIVSSLLNLDGSSVGSGCGCPCSRDALCQFLWRSIPFLPSAEKVIIDANDKQTKWVHTTTDRILPSKTQILYEYWCGGSVSQKNLIEKKERKMQSATSTSFSVFTRLTSLARRHAFHPDRVWGLPFTVGSVNY